MRAGRLASLRRDGEVRRSGLGRVQGECLPTNRSRPPSSRKCSRRQSHPLLSLRSLLRVKSGVLTAAAAVSLPGRGTCGQIAGDGFAVNNGEGGGGADGDGWAGPGVISQQPSASWAACANGSAGRGRTASPEDAKDIQVTSRRRKSCCPARLSPDQHTQQSWI